MFANINVDCCKTPGCKNLGVLNSPDVMIHQRYDKNRERTEENGI